MVASVLVIALALVIGVGSQMINSSFDKALARYKAAGMPWTADEVNLMKLPADKDAGPRLFSLAEKFDQLKPEISSLRNSLLTPQLAAEFEMSLEPRTKLMEEYEPIAEMDVFWDKDWDEGMDLLLPEFGNFKAMTRAFPARMELRSYRGDVKGSLEDLHLGSSIVKQSGTSPVLIGLLVQIANRNIMTQAILRSASYHLADPATLEAYAEAAEALKPNVKLSQALRAESYCGIVAMRNWSIREVDHWLLNGSLGLGIPEGRKELIRSGNPRSAIPRFFAVPLLEYWAEYGEAMKAQGDTLEATLEVARKMNARANSIEMPRGTMVAILSVDMTRAVEAAIRTEADHRNLLAALKLAARRARRGGVTDAEVEALLPEDPFTHQPMKAALTEGTIKLWSLGLDKTDQGGFSRVETGSSPHDLPTHLPWRHLKKATGPGPSGP